MPEKKINIEVELRKAIKAKKIRFGEKQTKDAIISGNAKLIVLPDNCFYQSEVEKIAAIAKIELFNFEGNSYKLGSVCERQHAVNSLVILK